MVPASLSLHSGSGVFIIATAKFQKTVQYGHAGICLARENPLAESKMSCVCRARLPGAPEDPGDMEEVEIRQKPEPKKYLLALQELWFIQEDTGSLGKTQ